MFNNFEREAFRLEEREIYKIDDEWNLFQKFKKGEPVNEIPSEKEFRELIAKDVSKGKSHTRVRVVPDNLNDYIRFEIELAYKKQLKIGHNILFISKSRFDDLVVGDFIPGDFYLFDDKVVIKLKYTENGEFLETESVEDNETIQHYIQLKKILLKNAEPFDKWLSIEGMNVR